MTLAFGRDHLAIPGPSVMPDRVLRAMHRGAPNIYGGELIDVADDVVARLNILAGHQGDLVIYIGNGHAAWEATLCNLFSRGDTALGLINGRFGRHWVQMAERLGIQVQRLESGEGEPAEPRSVEAALRADTGHLIKAVMTVQTDTSTSVDNDIPALRRAIDEAGHPALLLVDCIATFGSEPFRMQEWGVDVMLAACQKGLMTPPGLAFTFVRDSVWSLQEKAALNTPYWDWESRIHASAFPMRFGGTPPTHHLYGLQAALDMLFEEGIEQVWQRHRSMARLVWCAVEQWGQGSDIGLVVPDEAHRSTAVTTIATRERAAVRIREWCEREAGVVLGIGMAETPESERRHDLFRIGHMGHLNPPMLLGTLATIDTALTALSIPHGQGAMEAVCHALADDIGPGS